eukprot:scaffold58919_cov19-Tisochrysis_lutea.AAC.3
MCCVGYSNQELQPPAVYLRCHPSSVRPCAAVNNLLFKGCWDASSHSVQLLEDMHALPTKDQYSIALSEPAILLPAFLPEQQHPARPQNYSVSFSVSVSAPTGAELVGWQNSRGASTVEGGWRGEEGVLQLLAHTRGMFLPVEVTEVSRADEGQRTVQGLVLKRWVCPCACARAWCGVSKVQNSKAGHLLSEREPSMLSSKCTKWRVTNSRAAAVLQA